MNLASTDFELFDMLPRFALDRATLDARWKALQATAHPDRFAAQGAPARRAAMQWAVRINEAYQRLKDPLKRAAYLCRLNGVSVDGRDNQQVPASFLMQQMQWREALEAAHSEMEVQALAEQVEATRRIMLGELAVLIDDRADWQAAARQVQALMFVVRFAEDVDHRLEALGQ
jgi:molecular chaperone HscB